jgi:CHASE2 domain-containing sensor protein
MTCPNRLKHELVHCLDHFLRSCGKQLREKSLNHWLIAALLIGVGTYAGHKLGESNIWMDLRYRAFQSLLYRLTPRAPHPKRTVLVLINDQEFWGPPLDGRRPLKRGYLAKLVRQLGEANAEVIALDVDLSLPVDRAVYETGPYKRETDDLLQAVKDVSRQRTVVLARRLVRDHSAGEEFDSAAAVFDGFPFDGGNVRFGYITLPRDIRRIPLAITLQDRTTKLDSFASAILGAIDEQSLTDAKQKEHDALPYGSFINPDRFLQRSANCVLTSDVKTLQKDMAFKVVIVGGAWHQYGINQGPEYDSHPSPVGDVYGAFVHANYVEALLDSRTYTPMRQSLATGIEVVFSMVLAVLLSLNFHLPVKVAIAALLCAAIFGISYVSWQNLGLFFDFFVPVLLLVGHVVIEKVIEPSK